MDEAGDIRRERWERAGNWPLTVAAVLFLAAYAWPILDPELADPWLLLCRVVTWLAWVAFVGDYVVRVWLSGDRRRYVLTHLFDLAVVALPILRPLRLLRLVTLLSVLNRYAGSSLRGRVALYVASASALVIGVAALAALDAERGEPGSTIDDYGDALWWATTTVTTVGYGDQFPVTATGRFVAAGLMICGIALIGVVTASFASWLIERVAEVEEAAEAATRRDVLALTEEVRALRAEVAGLREPAPETPEG